MEPNSKNMFSCKYGNEPADLKLLLILIFDIDYDNYNQSVKEVVIEKKEEVTKVETPTIEELNIPLIKLDNHTCRWPLGDPRDEDFCFCG